jgi:hypothetical protein
MSDAEVSVVKARMEEVPLSLRVDRYAEQLKGLVEKETPEIQDVVQVMASLMFAPRDPSITAEVLASAVSSTVAARKGREGEDPKQKVERMKVLEMRLRDLFSTPALKLYSRASDVQHQYEHILTDARIMSDIRTVFDPESDGSKPMGAMVVHNLKIAYISNYGHRDSYFALDNADLLILQEAIARAVAKTSTLEGIIKTSNLRYFESK